MWRGKERVGEDGREKKGKGRNLQVKNALFQWNSIKLFRILDKSFSYISFVAPSI